MSRSAVLFVLLAAGCSRTPAEDPPPAPPVPADAPAPAPVPAPPAQDPNWRAKYGLPEEIDPQKVSFEKPAVGETFLKLDAAARKIAGKDWEKRAGDRYPYYSWNFSSGPNGFSQTYRGVWEKVANPERGSAARPNHTIHLYTTLNTGNPPAHGFEMGADWNPKTGWGAKFDYTSSERKDGRFESFHLTLRHDEHLPAPRDPNKLPGLMFGPGRTYLDVSRAHEIYQYRFLVLSLPGGAPGFPKAPIGREIARYWTSADSFREAALEELDKLETNAKEGITSGKLAEIMTRGGPTGAQPPMKVQNKEAPGSNGVGVAVPEALKKEMLKEALAEIESRKKLVKEHYKEMHAATVAAFPGFGEILSPPKK